MTGVEEHLARCLDGMEALSPLELQILEAQGCILAQDVVAPWDLPSADSATVDGYAVRVADVAQASSGVPVLLPVVGDVQPGPGGVLSVQPGLSARIVAGSALPAGAEAVVPKEWTDGSLTGVTVQKPVERGANVRARGGEVAAGSVVVEEGIRLGPAHVALLAAVGRDRVIARPRPRVVVMSVGDDLIEPGITPLPGQRTDSNAFLLTSAVRGSGADAFRVGVVANEPRVLSDAIEDQLIRADVVLLSTSGPRSTNVLREVLSRLGSIQMDTVSMRPGAQQGFGRIGPDATPTFVVPGDPVSAYVSFEVFVRPVLRRMLGVEPLHRPAVRAVAKQVLSSEPGARAFLPAALSVEEGRYVVTPVDAHGARDLGALTRANALVVLPENATYVPIGNPVTVMVLERRLA